MLTKTLLMLLGKIQTFYLENLIIIHKGKVTAKIAASVKVAAPTSVFVAISEKITVWTMANTDYILWVLWAIFVDWLVGVAYHLKTKDFSWGKNALGICLKLGLAIFAGSLFEAIPYFLKHDTIISNLLLITTRLAVFLYPAGSAFMNMYEVTDGVFPPIGFIKKIKLFNEKFDVKALGDEQKEE